MAIIDDLSIKGFNEFFDVFNFSRNDKDVLLKTKKDGDRCLLSVYRLDDLLNNRSIEESLFLISKSKKTGIKKMFTDYLVRYDNINRDK